MFMLRNHFLITFIAASLTASAQVHPDQAFDMTMGLPPMILVQGGSFQVTGYKGIKNTKAQDTVTLDNFYIGKYEVTQELWKKVMGDAPSIYQGCPDCPVENVSPERIDTFIDKLNRLSGNRYRLPSEAEWEYAARGGEKSKGYLFSGSNELSEVAWYKPNADGKTHPVGQKKPNELGIYDMAGNVWELCANWYDEKAKLRIVRGGSWRSEKNRCYSKARNRNIPDHYKFGNGGFRLVLAIDENKL